MTIIQAASENDTVANILASSPHAARLLLDRRMHCIGCAIAPFETIAEACAIYGVSVDTLLLDLIGLDRGVAPPSEPAIGACPPGCLL
jgi:hybrid cluster-associated redox disulfide protein